MENKINLDPFMGKINGYKLSFFETSTVGKLTARNGDYITIEFRDGKVIETHIDTIISIWHIRSKQDPEAI